MAVRLCTGCTVCRSAMDGKERRMFRDERYNAKNPGGDASMPMDRWCFNQKLRGMKKIRSYKYAGQVGAEFFHPAKQVPEI